MNDSIIFCEINANAIYSDSIVKIILSSQAPFFIPTAIFNIINILKGKISGDEIESISKDDKHSIEIDVKSFFKELEIHGISGCSVATYGMRFYPFVSSTIVKDIIVRNGKIKTINISLPDDYRLTWYKSSVVSGDIKASLSHSYSSDKSNYIFVFDSIDNLSDTAHMKLALRLGGNKLFKMLEFSLYYWFVTLFGLAFVATQRDFRLLMIAVVTAWIFMFKQFGNANVPQKNTFLLRAYIVFGILTMVFALLMKITVFLFQNYLFIEPMILMGLTILSYILIIISSLRIIRKFELTGRLPRIIEKYWLKKMCASDLNQKSLHNEPKSIQKTKRYSCKRY